MSGLSGFFAQNALQVENEMYVASKRYLDETGEPLKWEIRCLDSDENEALQKSCIKQVPTPGMRGHFTREVDRTLYNGKLMAACTVYPNLNDAELQNSYGVMGAEALLKKMLNPGEYSDYFLKVQKINGFDVPFEEAVEEAKN